MHPAIYRFVCGRAPSKRAGRQFCVVQPLQAYVDDSTEGGVVLILAGYIASVSQWDAFSVAWETLLAEYPTRHVFKMRSVNLNNPIDVEKLERHYRIIEKYIPFGFCMAMPHEPYKAVCEELGVQKRYQRPFNMAWVLLLSSFRKFYTQAQWKQSLDLFFDEHISATDVSAAWDELVERQKGDIAPFRSRPIFVRDDDFLPLQAADLLAWWARKNWVQHKTFKNQAPLFPWNEGHPGPDYMYFEMEEAGIRKHVMDNLSCGERGHGGRHTSPYRP